MTIDPVKLSLALKASGLHPTAPPSILHVEDRYLITDGWMQPRYYEPATSALYLVGGVPPAAPTTADSTGTTFPAATVVNYRFTSYNSRYDVETAPVDYQHTVGGAAKNITHTFTDPALVDPQYDKVRFYRQLVGGDFKLAATVAGSAGTWIDNVSNATLEAVIGAQVVRLRITLPPKFRGWVFFNGRIFAWSGLDAILRLSQLRRVDGRGNVLTDFPDDNIFPVEPNDGYGVITCVVADGEALYVFKERAIYRVYGGPDPTDMDIEIVCAGRGAIAQHSVVRVAGVIMFLGEDGVMLLPPGGLPQVAAMIPKIGVSPLKPLWKRVNRRALPYVRAWHDIDAGRYVLRLPLDDDPVVTTVTLLEYRISAMSQGYSYSSARFFVDDEVYVACSADILDGGGSVHPLGMDDQGNVIELDMSDEDLLAVGVLATATISSVVDVHSVATNGAWATSQQGLGLEFRHTGLASAFERNRVLLAAGDGSIVHMYYPSTAPVAGDVVELGCIRGRFRTPSLNLGDVRHEKEIGDVTIQMRTGGTGTVSEHGMVMNGAAPTGLDPIDLATTDGLEVQYANGVRGNLVAFHFENANPREPWSLTAVAFTHLPGRERK